MTDFHFGWQFSFNLLLVGALSVRGSAFLSRLCCRLLAPPPAPTPPLLLANYELYYQGRVTQLLIKAPLLELVSSVSSRLRLSVGPAPSQCVTLPLLTLSGPIRLTAAFTEAAAAAATITTATAAASAGSDPHCVFTRPLCRRQVIVLCQHHKAEQAVFRYVQ